MPALLFADFNLRLSSDEHLKRGAIRIAPGAQQVGQPEAGAAKFDS